MSGGFQQVIIVGNLGADPEVRVTQSGKTVTNFNVAVNTGSGEYERTEWFRCVAWEKTGEIIGEYTRKGSKVQVLGEMRTDSWEDQESGEKKYRTNLIARQVLLLDSKAKGSGGYEEEDEHEYGTRKNRRDEQRRSAPAKGSGTSKPAQTRRPVAPPLDDDDLPF